MDTVPYKMNFPRDVKDWVEREADKNLRSQSAQIIFILRKAMETQNAQP